MKRWWALLVLLVLVWSCAGPQQPPATNPTPSTAPGAAQDSKTTNTPATAASHPSYLPDPKLTPGDTLDATVDDICTPGYSKKIRNVPASVKRKAYEEYGITSHVPGEYEVDHLISLELGDSNSIKNLWPESYRGEKNAHVKDRLENKLHHLVCSGEVDLKTAQQEIATDWVSAYKKYIGEPGEQKPHHHRRSH